MSDSDSAENAQPQSAPLAGVLLLAMIALSVAHGIVPAFPAYPAGVAAWCAGLLLMRGMHGTQMWQTVLLLLLGSVGIIWGATQSGTIDWMRALSANQALLAMLGGVSFLRLVALPQSDVEERLPVGRAPLWRTLLGVHLFGAVINYSSIIIIADRLSLRRPLSQLQAIVLSRGFSAAATWSPFFAAMGVALTHAPGAHLLTLSLVGLPVALAALLFTGLALARHPQIDQFHGYPMHVEALRLPLLLALAVLGINALWPQLAILTVVTLLAICVTGLLLLPRGTRGLARFGQHITRGLPQMRGELVLFLAAGLFATGISALLDAHDLAPQLTAFGPGAACMLLLGMVALSAVGVHPVISIATVSGILMPVVADPNLLGITFLMSWALGVTYSPLSGMHLAMQGRYGINAFGFLRWNAGYVAFMLLVDGIALFTYSALT